MFDAELRRVLKDLDNLVGLDEFKVRFKNLVDEVVGRRFNRDTGGSLPRITLQGNPGTGKTSVMRILGDLYWLAGMLRYGHMPRPSDDKLAEPWTGTQLKGSFVGETTPKVQTAIQDALGGVFALDEVHGISDGKDQKGYGIDVIRTLVPAMTENESILWIIAGYPDSIEKDFLDNDPGLKSRFSDGFVFNFPDYTADQMVDILTRCCLKRGFRLSDSAARCLTQSFWSVSMGQGLWECSNCRNCCQKNCVGCVIRRLGQ
jgi:stage V sporulation protein K